MLDLLAATAAFTVVVALALALLAALTVVPFVLALRSAEQRGASSTVAGALALGCSLVGLAVVGLVLRSDLPSVLALVGAGITLAGPLLVPALAATGVAARTGRHH